MSCRMTLKLTQGFQDFLSILKEEKEIDIETLLNDIVVETIYTNRANLKNIKLNINEQKILQGIIDKKDQVKNLLTKGGNILALL